MNYKYEIIKYNKNIPAKIWYLDLSSDTHKTELHWHREPELVYVLEGEAECTHNSETKYVKAGNIIFFNSEDVHLVRPIDKGRAKLLLIHFSIDYMLLFCNPPENIVFNIEPSANTKADIIAALNELAVINVNEDKYAALAQISLINKLYYILIKNCMCLKQNLGGAVVPKKDFSYAKTAIAYLNKNYSREITLNEIASVVSLSPSYFSKYFKSVTKMGFSEYLANLRLEKAIQDMLKNNTSVSSAAARNGFANVKSFITQCKRVHGTTPVQHKKKLLNS